MIMRQSARTDEATELVDLVRRQATRIEISEDLDPLMERIGDARYVLIGEASHGTSDFYAWRARLSQRLIAEKGFSFVAVEGDWPDCYRVNRYVKGYENAGETALEVLMRNERWPTWMWSNWETVSFAEWLVRHNRDHGTSVGFYGLDVYSLWESMEAILSFLRERDPETLATAYAAYRCFEPYEEDPQSYARGTMFVPEGCEEEVVKLLRKIREQVPTYNDPEAAFDAEQNAHVAVGAERYYRSMVSGRDESWNVRDTHMVDTLDRLMRHHGDGAKAILWEHNTHVGDARATTMSSAGMVNVGELVRRRHDDDGVVIVGFGTYRGTVIAAEEWGAPMEVMQVPEARPGSWEAIFNQAAEGNRLLLLDALAGSALASQPRGHRAIGVVYDPRSDRYANYVPSVLPERYDAFIQIDQSRALHPLHIDPRMGREMPETYPWGM